MKPHRPVKKFQGMKSGATQGNLNGKNTIRKKTMPFPKPSAPSKPTGSVVQMIKSSDGTMKRIEYELGRMLGKGGFAYVYEARSRPGDKVYAAKVIAKSSLTKKRAKEKLISEIKIHRRLNHQNVVKFHTYFEDREYVYIMLELCTQQTLMQLLKAKKFLSEEETRRYMTQTISGIEYLHNRKVIHRDLKLGNLMLDEGMNVKIGDFGLAAQLKEETDRRKTVCGTPNYIAPEILNKREHGFEVDVWSLGVIFYTLLVGRPAFESTDVKTTYKRIKGNTYSFPEGSSVSDEARDLIAIMLSPDPSTRPSLEQIKHHAFFTKTTHHPPRTLNPRLPGDVIQSVLPPKNSRPALKASSDVTRGATIVGAKRTARRALQVCSSTSAPHAQGSTASTANKRAKVNAPHERGKRRSAIDIIHDTLQHSFARKDLEITGETPQKENAAQCRDIAHGGPRGELCPPTIWLSKWVDFSKKYGVGYTTNVGSCGAYFNDGTKIILAAKGREFDYVTYDKPVGKRTRYSLEEFPADLEKKVNLLQHFQEYLEKKEARLVDIPGVEADGEDHKGSEMAYVEKWMQTKHAAIFVISSGALQVDFKTDRTRLIISDGGHSIAYTDKHGRTSLSHIHRISNPSLINRLSYTRDILKHFLC